MLSPGFSERTDLAGFYQMILWHFPKLGKGHAFKKPMKKLIGEIMKRILRWCEGRTGYPLVDAGMHQLNQTGFMHNRVRMQPLLFYQTFIDRLALGRSLFCGKAP
jgi:deoxyribodipyrimidine photolyase